MRDYLPHGLSVQRRESLSTSQLDPESSRSGPQCRCPPRYRIHRRAELVRRSGPHSRCSVRRRRCEQNAPNPVGAKWNHPSVQRRTKEATAKKQREGLGPCEVRQSIAAPKSLTGHASFRLLTFSFDWLRLSSKKCRVGNGNARSGLAMALKSTFRLQNAAFWPRLSFYGNYRYLLKAVKVIVFVRFEFGLGELLNHCRRWRRLANI